MSRAAFRRVIANLPPRLRDQLDGYVQTVEMHASDIFDDAGVPITPERRNQLVFIAGVRRLWALVDGQYELLHNTLDTLGGQEVDAISIGSTVYAPGSPEYRRVRLLRDQLRERLQELGALDYVQAGTLADIPPMLAEG